jgi:protein-tyrosine-phosphatase
MTGNTTMRARAVLFLCNRNAIRSPMAAVLHNNYMCGHLGAAQAESAGVKPGEPDPLSQLALSELGLAIPEGPRPVESLKLGRFDLIVALSPQAQHRALELTRNLPTPVEFWHVVDPSLVDGSREQRLAAYRMVRDDLARKLKERFPASA